MRDSVALVVLGIVLGVALGVLSYVLVPAEWYSDLHKHPYWPFTVELSVRDR